MLSIYDRLYNDKENRARVNYVGSKSGHAPPKISIIEDYTSALIANQVDSAIRSVLFYCASCCNVVEPPGSVNVPVSQQIIKQPTSNFPQMHSSTCIFLFSQILS
jgi:hypothetical protein